MYWNWAIVWLVSKLNYAIYLVTILALNMQRQLCKSVGSLLHLLPSLPVSSSEENSSKLTVYPKGGGKHLFEVIFCH